MSLVFLICSRSVLAGPPVAGALYGRWGFRAPFIFGIIMTAIDLIGRFLIIERKDAIIWGLDPAAGSRTTALVDEERSEETNNTESTSPPTLITVTPTGDRWAPSEGEISQSHTAQPPTHVTPLWVLMRLLRSSRAMACIFNAVVYG
jgi:MFS transporter, DHA1 family, solute carrier family 18 (vesicular amine transporter), member 1/2